MLNLRLGDYICLLPTARLFYFTTPATSEKVKPSVQVHQGLQSGTLLSYIENTYLFRNYLFSRNYISHQLIVIHINVGRGIAREYGGKRGLRLPRRAAVAGVSFEERPCIGK